MNARRVVRPAVFKSITRPIGFLDTQIGGGEIEMAGKI
jgi:hypothetical protein